MFRNEQTYKQRLSLDFKGLMEKKEKIDKLYDDYFDGKISYEELNNAILEKQEGNLSETI